MSKFPDRELCANITQQASHRAQIGLMSFTLGYALLLFSIELVGFEHILLGLILANRFLFSARIWPMQFRGVNSAEVCKCSDAYSRSRMKYSEVHR